jgi:D-alanyl-D-alanine carboxypeptidase
VETVAVAPAEEVLIAEAAPEPELTEVETVAAAETAPAADPAPVAPKTASVKPARSAPIFDSPEEPAVIETAEAAAPAEEVVVAKSTSGGRHFGVNVGNYTSRSQAERELLKVALVESATLSQGLRKISEKGGKYHANFMGLTQDQAALACRRLKARGVACETLGS